MEKYHKLIKIFSTFKVLLNLIVFFFRVENFLSESVTKSKPYIYLLFLIIVCNIVLTTLPEITVSSKGNKICNLG